jgi:hypothetical protein
VLRAAAVLVLALAALTGAAAHASARSLQVGIDDDGVLLGGGDAAGDAVAKWQKLGVDTVRVQVSWSRVVPDPGTDTPPPDFVAADPDSPGYHWGVIDAAVDRLAAAGIEPILMLDGPPPLWASGNPTLGNPRYRPSAPAFGAFASAAAQRYGTRVDHYILWNEPNLPLWIQPQANCGRKRCSPASADIYRAMVNAGYEAIHTVDPAATVLIGALAPAGGDLKSRNANMRPLTFLRALGCLDAKLRPVTTGGCRGFQPALADGLAYHPHSTRNPPDQPFATADNADLASLSRIEHLLDLMQRWGRIRGSIAPLGIWLDEYGFQTNPPDKLRGVSPGRQDLYLQQAAYLALARSARPAALAVPVGRRAARRRQALHRLAVGPELRRRHAQARAGAFRPPDVAGLRRQHAVGAGPARRRPHRRGPGPRRRRRDPVAARGRHHDR